MTPEYFKRELRPYEAEAYLKGVEQARRVGWEQTRNVMYSNLAPWSRDLKPSDVMKFEWDGETKTEATREEIDDVRQWAAMVATTINKHGEQKEHNRRS